MRILNIMMILIFSFTNIALANHFSIAALVNDQVISALDLEHRIKLALGTSNIPYNEETITHFTPQILYQMIDDLLKIQEAERLGIEITEADFKDAITTIENNNHITPGDLEKMVASLEVNQSTFQMQIKAEIAWLKIAKRVLMPNINISDDEIHEIIEKQKANIGKPEMLVSEIFLPVDDPGKEDEIFGNARKIIGYVASGVDFSAMAKQFSQSPTAANGGNLGWVYEGQLEKELNDVIREMTPPSISSPIKTRYGYYILLLRDKKLASTPDETKAIYHLSQIFIPKDIKSLAKDNLLIKIKNLTSCDDFNSLAHDFGSDNSGSLGIIPANKMPPAIFKMVKDLSLETPSNLMPVNEGSLIFMVCDKTIPGGLLSEAEIKNQLEIEKLDKMARQKLRELRRNALIEIRK